MGELPLKRVLTRFEAGVGEDSISDGPPSCFIHPANSLPGEATFELLPGVSTPQGITLGSTLSHLRRAYRRLDFVGADRWMAGGVLIFYDDALRDPPPASSRIIGIKIGTCGAF